MHMFFGIPQRYIVDIYGFYFEEYILGYLADTTNIETAILIMTLGGFPNCKFTVSLNVNSTRYAPWVPFGNP